MKDLVKLDDVLKYEQPTKYIVDSINYDNSFSIPVLTAGKSFILGYTDELDGIYNDLPVIIFDDFTTAFHYVDFPFKVKSSAMKILKPVKEKADLKYLFYRMQTISMDTDLHKRYWISKYSQVKIPLPPLPQQQKIASILDAADALRQKDKALLAKYDELTQALFLDMFGDPVSNPKGWENLKLGLLTNMKAGKFISASEILSENNNDLFSCYGGNGLRGFVKSHTHEGDFVLIGRKGALCGNVKVTDGKFHATEHAIVCSPKMQYQTLWLYYLLKMMNLNRFATGAAQPGLNVGTLVDLEIISTPISLQNQFAERVQVIEQQKAIAQQSLEKSEALFNSLLQKAFKGELV
jgi:type I restriction enzyme S subunit